MGFLRSSHNNPAAVPHYTGLQIQTSSNAVPIAILWGTAKIAPNVIWTGGFYSVPQYQKQGGKGGGGRQLTGYEYFTSFAMGLCEGPIGGFGRIWVGQGIHGGLYGTGLTFARYGGTPQAPWPFLAAYGQQSLGYNGLAYIAANNFDLGSSPVLPQFSLEVFGFFTGSGIHNTFDADPALVVQDFLTNSQYGVGFPAASIDATTLLSQGSSDASYQNYCRAAFLAFSPALVNQESANSILARWLQLTNTAAVWSGGKLKFIPYGDTSFSGNGLTFTPNVAPIYGLTDDDFIHEDSKDPLDITRSDPYASYNWQRLNVTDRYNSYNALPVDAWDQNAIELYGLRMAPEITATEFRDPYVGVIAAQLILQRQLYIRNTYHFKLSFEYCLLEPMDLVTVTDSALGLTNVAVRITSIEEDDAGLLSVTAEEFPGGIATAVQYPVQSNQPNATNQAVVPARVNPPVIYEPPGALTNNVAQVWAAVSGGVATAYKLAEDGSTGLHATTQAMLSPRAVNDTISFSIYAQAVERNKVRLAGDTGAATIGCEFDLAAGIAKTPDAGVTAAISPAGGNWFQLSISYLMATASAPTIRVQLEANFGSSSYAGVTGNGIYIWGAEYAWTNPASGVSQALTFLPAFASFTGATYTVNAVSTPEGAAGVADPNWGGAFVWISTDDITYGQIGAVTAPARQGVTTTSMTPSSTTVSVDLEESGGQLLNATAADAANGITLCLVDNELIAYQTATLLTPPPPNAYSLTGVVRAFYGTVAASHSAGAPFARLDSAIFQYNLPAAYIGVPLYMKFQSFNIFGLAVEDLSECTVYTYTPTGAGQALGPVTIALLNNTSQDFRFVSETVFLSDQWGLASDLTINAIVDLGAGIP